MLVFLPQLAGSVRFGSGSGGNGDNIHFPDVVLKTLEELVDILDRRLPSCCRSRVACAAVSALIAVSIPASPEVVADCLNARLPAIMVLVSTERISATAASDMTTSAISAKNSTTPR